MKGLTVRQCSRADVSQLASLGQSVFRQTYGATAPADDLDAHIAEHFGEEAVTRDIARPSVKYFMAESGEQCAGFVKIRKGADYALLRSDAVREVQQLYVAPDFQRRGVGRLLMDAAVSDARDLEAPGIVLSVWTEADWATSFYQGYGFRTLGEVPYRLGRVEYQDWLMWLPLR